METLKDLITILAPLAQTGVVVFGAIWGYRKYVAQRDNKAKVEFSVDMRFLGLGAGGEEVVELVAIFVNRGVVRHKISSLDFKVRYLSHQDRLEDGPEAIGARLKTKKLREGSWLPPGSGYTFIDGGIRQEYTFPTFLPGDARFITLKGRFEYEEGGEEHTSERIFEVPSRVEGSVPG